MNPHRTCQENMDALKKVLTQRTLLALSRRNVEFVLAHQADSNQQLADYLRQCRAELGHIPGRTEVIGGDLIELRFRGWANALCASGVPAEQAVRRVHPALTKTDLFQKEFEAQRLLDKRTKAERKKANLEQAKQDAKKMIGFALTVYLAGGVILEDCAKIEVAEDVPAEWITVERVVIRDCAKVCGSAEQLPNLYLVCEDVAKITDGQADQEDEDGKDVSVINAASYTL